MSIAQADDDDEMMADEAEHTGGTNGAAGGAKKVGRPPGRPPKEQAIQQREREAQFVWGEILTDALPKRGSNPAQVAIFVSRTSGGTTTQVGNWPGSATPDVDSFYNYLVQQIHAKTRGPAIYEVSFRWRGNGQTIRNATLSLPSIDEMAVGPAQGAMGMGAPPPQWGYTPYGFQPPPAMAQGYVPQPPPWMGQQMMQPPQPPQHDAGVGASPQQHQQQQQQQGPVQSAEGLYLQQQMGNMRVEMTRMMGDLVGAIRELRSPSVGAPPPPAAIPVATPAPPASLADQIAAALVKVGIGQQVGVAAPPMPSPPSPAVAERAGGDLGSLMSLIKTMRGLKEVVREAEEVFSPEDGPFEEAGAPAVGLGAAPLEAVPVDPNAGLPFDVVPIPDVKIFGHEAKYTRNKETGSIDWKGFVMANPGLVEKGVEMLSKLGEAAAKVAQGQAQAPGVTVVGDTPAGAVDATPSAPPPAAPPPADGSGGWDLG